MADTGDTKAYAGKKRKAEHVLEVSDFARFSRKATVKYVLEMQDMVNHLLNRVGLD